MQGELKHDRWVVVLVEKPAIDDYRSDFFPRNFYYKEDAEQCVREVRRKGGDAKVVRNF